MSARGSSLAGLCLLGGCGFLDAEGDPVIEAHAGAQGHYPANSRAAIEHALDAGYPAIEFDLGLTGDGQLVLAHDPWIDGERCADNTGAPLQDKVWLADLTLDELVTGYQCGGLPNADFPDAAVVADSMMPYAELLERLAGHPEVLLHHDLKYDPSLGLAASAWPDALLPVWDAAGLPNPWYIDSPWPELLGSFTAVTTVRTSLAWPQWSLERGEVGTVLGAEFGEQVGLVSVLDAVEASGADSVGIYWQIADRRLVEALAKEGVEVQVYAPETERQLDDLCRWPLEAIITDYPERAPCWSR